MPSINDSKCVLVTGATAGIGRSLALSIRELPSRPRVIAAGRRKDRLDEVAGTLETVQIDLDTDKETLKNFVDTIVSKYPDLDSVVLCAGIQREFYFDKPETVDLDNIISELNVNYTSIVTLITYFLPHFLKLGAQGHPCFIIPVTSGLSIIPAPWVPSYSASKAALHSFTMSLRAQLQNTNVHVMEIIPPLVESELHDAEGTTEKLSKMWMPLDEYTKVTMEGLKNGDTQIAAGQSAVALKRFEEGKDEAVHKLLGHRKDW